MSTCPNLFKDAGKEPFLSFGARAVNRVLAVLRGKGCHRQKKVLGFGAIQCDPVRLGAIYRIPGLSLDFRAGSANRSHAFEREVNG
jgi:hypothetical protein